MHAASSRSWIPARFLGATRTLTRAQELAIGVGFLLLCGWKMTDGLSRTLDLDVSWHEARYLAWVTHHADWPVPPEYSPLYVAFYQLEEMFRHNPVHLYYLHVAVIAILLPIAFFAYLWARSVPFVLALSASTYLLISAADLPVAPKPVHLALTIMFVALAIFVRLNEGRLRWLLILVAAGCLASVRPELLISFAVLAVYVAYRAARERPVDWGMAVTIPAALACLAPLWWRFGVPLFNERSMDAFSRHFTLNYVAWQHLGEDPLSADHLAIFHSVFGDATSIPAAFIANPLAFLHHVGLNVVHTPKAVIELFLGHYNVLLPRFEPYVAIEALLLGAVLLTIGLWAWRWAPGWLSLSSGPPGRGSRNGHGWEALLRDYPDGVCLFCFLIPYPIMLSVLYPRYHYALGLGLILIALGFIALAPRLRLPRLRIPGALAFLLLLLALTPSLGSAGASFTAGKIEVESRPNWNTVEYLRAFHPQSPIGILEAAWVEPFLDRNFTGVSQEEKHSGFLEFLAERHIGVVIANDRVRNDRRFSLDPEWQKFAADPERFGFRTVPIEESDILVYLRDDIAGPRQ